MGYSRRGRGCRVSRDLKIYIVGDAAAGKSVLARWLAGQLDPAIEVEIFEDGTGHKPCRDESKPLDLPRKIEIHNIMRSHFLGELVTLVSDLDWKRFPKVLPKKVRRFIADVREKYSAEID